MRSKREIVKTVSGRTATGGLVALVIAGAVPSLARSETTSARHAAVLDIHWSLPSGSTSPAAKPASKPGAASPPKLVGKPPPSPRVAGEPPKAANRAAETPARPAVAHRMMATVAPAPTARATVTSAAAPPRGAASDPDVAARPQPAPAPPPVESAPTPPAGAATIADERLDAIVGSPAAAEADRPDRPAWREFVGIASLVAAALWLAVIGWGSVGARAWDARWRRRQPRLMIEIPLAPDDRIESAPESGLSAETELTASAA